MNTDLLLAAPAHPGRWRRLLLIVLLVMAVQLLGGLLTSQSVHDWYPTLDKAPWNPPAWVFGPVWSLLYALMAWTGWRVWQCLIRQGYPAPLRHPAMQAFFCQLGLNLLWSAVFFGLQAPVPALVVLVLLLMVVARMLQTFRTVDNAAFYSQISYALWLAFAATLNAAIIYLNP